MLQATQLTVSELEFKSTKPVSEKQPSHNPTQATPSLPSLPLPELPSGLCARALADTAPSSSGAGAQRASFLGVSPLPLLSPVSGSTPLYQETPCQEGQHRLGLRDTILLPLDIGSGSQFYRGPAAT